MPWEKAFDIDKSLDQAADVFMAKGYAATSITDLTKGMGINKGSLYNAFGSKQELFKLVLEKFIEKTQGPLQSQLSKMTDPVEAIEMLFDVLMANCINDHEKKGNLVVNTAIDLPNHDEETRKVVCAAFEALEVFFETMIAKGQESGQIHRDLSPQDAAKSLVALSVGMRVLSRGAYDVAGLAAIKNSALRLIS